jgi:hypothetical protein
MGADDSTRRKFSATVSDAFSSANIQATITTLGTLIPTGDHLDYFEKLGLLTYLPAGKFAAYKAKLDIPQVNQQMITLALRYALTTATTVKFDVQTGTAETVTIAPTAAGMSILVTRAHFGPIP